MIDKYVELVRFFGDQHQTARKIHVTQASVSKWVTGKANMSADVAIDVELATDGEFLAEELSPTLRRYEELKLKRIKP